MKKRLSTLLLVFAVSCLTVLATACGDNDEPTRETNSNGETQSNGENNSDDSNGNTDDNGNSNGNEDSSEDATFGLDETAVFNNIRVTATEVEASLGEGFNTPDDGNVFIGVWFVIENSSSEDQHISTMLLFDAFADDVMLGTSLGAMMAFSEGSLDGTISAGRRMEGYYALEVPLSTQTLEIEMKSGVWTTGRAVFSFDISGLSAALDE
jgi:hypothetical protein